MKYLDENDFEETIKWRCPYKTCHKINTEYDISYWDLVSEKYVICRYCKRKIKIKTDY